MWQEGWQEAATTGVIRKKWNRKGKNPMIPGCPRKGLGAENLCGVPNLLYSLGLQKTAHILLTFLEIKLYVKKWQMHTNRLQVLEFYSPLNIGCRLMILIKKTMKNFWHTGTTKDHHLLTIKQVPYFVQINLKVGNLNKQIKV